MENANTENKQFLEEIKQLINNEKYSEALQKLEELKNVYNIQNEDINKITKIIKQ